MFGMVGGKTFNVRQGRNVTVSMTRSGRSVTMLAGRAGEPRGDGRNRTDATPIVMTRVPMTG